MDRETLRRQIYEEIQGEFARKLKEAKRQKQLAEEELEHSSAQWRAERRRLNSEIDRLEAALAEVKETTRLKSSEKQTGIDPVEVAKMQAAAEERLKKAMGNWEAERTNLKREISRLEKDLADAIERSSNPLRAAMPIRQELEAKIEQLKRENAELDAALARAKADWDQEKLRLAGEMVKLRRLAGSTKPVLHGKSEADEEARVKELEKEVKNLRDSAKEWEKERKQLTDYVGQLQGAFLDMKAKVEKREASEDTIDHRVKLEEAARAKAALERQFQEARDDWSRERRRLYSEIDQLKQAVRELSETSDRVSTEVVDQLRKQYDQKIQLMIQQKTQLAQELQSASALLEAERKRLTAEISKSKAAASSQRSIDEKALTAEVKRVERMIREVTALIDDPSTDLSTVIRKNVEKAELDAYLKGILFSSGRSKGL